MIFSVMDLLMLAFVSDLWFPAKSGMGEPGRRKIEILVWL